VDERFPKYLRWIVSKLSFIALPNLGMLVAGLAVLGFIGKTMLGAPMERFVFDPYLVMQGEWWRLFSYPVTEGIDNSPFAYFWFFFFVFYIHFILQTLETNWGSAPLTLFTAFSYWITVAASFVAFRRANIWYYVIENSSLAFGTLFPEIEFLLLGLLPVKAKWLTLFAGALILIQFVGENNHGRIFLLMVMSPYLIFFGPLLFRYAKTKYQVERNRRRFGGD
jgi:hypothetical protein